MVLVYRDNISKRYFFLVNDKIGQEQILGIVWLLLGLFLLFRIKVVGFAGLYIQ